MSRLRDGRAGTPPVAPLHFLRETVGRVRYRRGVQAWTTHGMRAVQSASTPTSVVAVHASRKWDVQSSSGITIRSGRASLAGPDRMAIPEEDWTSHSLLAWTAPPDVAVEADCTPRSVSCPSLDAAPVAHPLHCLTQEVKRRHARCWPSSPSSPDTGLSRTSSPVPAAMGSTLVTGGRSGAAIAEVENAHTRPWQVHRSSQMLESRSMPSGALRRVNGAWLAVQARWRNNWLAHAGRARIGHGSSRSVTHQGPSGWMAS